MEQVQPVEISILAQLPATDRSGVGALLSEELAQSAQKVVVLDDDPTGVQTVHGVPVYTDWTPQTVRQAFEEPGRMFFILTNSRSMTVPQTTAAHREIAEAVTLAARAAGKDYILISRSDSTLRGHYPLETAVLRETLESCGAAPFDGEILYPFFLEGGRFTLNNIHYVKEGDRLIPAGQTEFAKDRSFGYTASALPDWCAEKSGGV